MEIWRDIKGYEGIYQISDKGRIRSLNRIIETKNGVSKLKKGVMLKQCPNSKGYLRVELKNKCEVNRFFVHRLVALHFVENKNPAANNVVNHLDSNPLNNAATNLEWTTATGNMQHALKKGRLERTPEWLDRLHKSAEKQSAPVFGINPVNEEIVVSFKSIQEARRNGYDASSICLCCQGKRAHHRGLAWRYAHET